MKKNIWIGVALLLLLVGGVVMFTHTLAPSGARGVEVSVTLVAADTFMETFVSTPGAVLLDVRTGEEYAEGHIEGAINLDYYAADFKEKIDALDTSKDYFVYCRSGNRSSHAVRLLADAGVNSVHELKGGIASAPELLKSTKETASVRVDIGMEERTLLTLESSLGGLTNEEKNGLLQMREEEKLAHDVYQTLYETWGVQIFANIAQSEETHTEAVRTLLTFYGVADPVTTSTVGVFTNKDMQSLYERLTTQGSASLEDALIVGALIEDMDIVDLQKHIAATNKTNIQTVYENLMRGSRNHLRSFSSQLASRGATYTPEYLTPDDYTAIITTERETGGGGGSGYRGGR